jgi:hypothetical protein
MAVLLIILQLIAAAVVISEWVSARVQKTIT